MEVVLINKSDYDKIMLAIQELGTKVSALLSSKKNELGDEWLDSEDVLRALKISKRQLQIWRGDGTVGFTQIGRKKIYYKRVDIERLLETNFNKPFKD